MAPFQNAKNVEAHKYVEKQQQNAILFFILH